MGTITIQELEISCCIGVPDDERAKPQRLLVTLEMTVDLVTAVARDDVRWSIDYQAVAQRVAEFSGTRSWYLIETLASEIAELVMREFGALSVTVEVKKLVLPQTRYVSVRVVRPM